MFILLADVAQQEDEHCEDDRDYYEDNYGRLWGFVAEVPTDAELETVRLQHGVYKERRAKNVLRLWKQKKN